MNILNHFTDIITKATYPFVLEFGACDGYHSDLMIHELKKSEKPFIFHGFEPNQELHGQILDRLKGHLMFNVGLISIWPYAIGARNEEVDFYKSHGYHDDHGSYYGSSSIRKPKLVQESFPGMEFTIEKARTLSLDNFIRQQGLEGYPIDFIWADIQGAEVDLISGGIETFNYVRYFYTEYDNAESYEGQIGLAEILKLLPSFSVIEDYGGDILLGNNKPPRRHAAVSY